MNIFQSPPTKFQNHSRQIAIKDYRLKKTCLYLFPSLPHPLSNVGHEYFSVSADEFQNHSRQIAIKDYRSTHYQYNFPSAGPSCRISLSWKVDASFRKVIHISQIIYNAYLHECFLYLTHSKLRQIRRLVRSCCRARKLRSKGRTNSRGLKATEENTLSLVWHLQMFRQSSIFG